MGYIKPDSALVRAATDLLSRHAGQAGGTCSSCGEMSPCASARHAVEVRRAAGLPDTISASDPLVGGGNGSDVLGPLGGGSFGSGSGFGGNSSYGDTGAPALAVAGASALSGANTNAGAYGPGPSSNQPAHAPVGLSKVPADD